MVNNWINDRTPTSLFWSGAALGLMAAVGVALWLAGGASGAVLACVALGSLSLGAVWRSRARAARRWNAALDAYAEREIALARRWKSRKKGMATHVSTGGVR
jgi:hypothetical protein